MNRNKKIGFAALLVAAMVLAGFASCSKSNSASASGGGGADTPKKEAVSKKADGAALAKKIQALEAEKEAIPTDKIMKEEIDKHGMGQYAGEQAGKRIYEAKAKFDQQLKPLYEQVDNLDDGEYRKYAEAMGLITEPEYVCKLTNDGKGVIVTSYNGLDSTVNIPAEIEGFPVVQVMVGKWGAHSKRIKAITFPDTVQYLAVREGLPNLKEVTLPKTWRRVPSGTFQHCTVESVIIPDGVTSIDETAFYACYNLTSVTIPDSVTTIGEQAFAGSGLTSVTIPAGVKKIGKGAFSRCSSLASVTIPDGVKEIGDFAFNECSSLASVSIPDSVTTIGERAFLECKNLVDVTISPVAGRKWKGGGHRQFYGCPKLSLASQAAIKAAGYEYDF